MARQPCHLHCQAKGVPIAAGVVEDLGTGEYRAAFRATAAGVYVVAVQLGGRNIAGSPFAAAVAPAGVCAATSIVALAPAAAVAGQQARGPAEPALRRRNEWHQEGMWRYRADILQQWLALLRASQCFAPVRAGEQA